jgi:lambda family phage portal protein
MLFRKVRGPEQGRHGYKLQVLDVDRLDDMLNKALPGGGAIHMGIELDSQSRPVAYHLLKRKPASWQAGGYPREHERVPAADICHVFIPDFAEQVRGVPWMYAALLNLVHLGAFEEAAVIAARIGASQMGFIESPDGGETLAGQQAKDASGAPIISAEPGAMQTLPPGYKFNAGWNPRYPDAAIEPFVNALLRGIAVGVNVAHHNLSGNMEGVNYSSARIAELSERDHWMSVQNFVSEHMHQDNYDDWLRWQVLMGVLPFDLARLDKYRNVYWQGRRWQWVDPLKEVNAAILAKDHKLKSRTRIVAEGGEDIEDVFDEIAQEEALAKEKGIDLQPPAKPAAGSSTPAADTTDTADDSNETDEDTSNDETTDGR